MKIKTYSSPTDFRRALDERIVDIAKKENAEVQKLRRHVAFDRLLARLFTDANAPWVLKGGYAMQLRTPDARITRDVDLAIRTEKLLSHEPDEQNAAIRDQLIEKTRLDLGDFFSFVISDAIKDLEAAPYGGARFHVEAVVDEKTFQKFHLDIGIVDTFIEPLEQLPARPWLEFVGIKSMSYPAIPREQQFAEKIHAYTAPRPEGRRNSRTKDLIDMILLIETNTLDPEKLAFAVNATFKRRKTHKFESKLLSPPTFWKEPYAEMAKESGLSPDLDASFQIVQDFISKVFS
ncbi:MAG: nucleotidyl transferase AbiEii/AbiGii toxin family protein [Xanthomonadaceae bacterium]|nr:nucleotidyl transferase AbiEii/AbiGii toxin family protein [Xanthomonadaceae bacterium]